MVLNGEQKKKKKLKRRNDAHRALRKTHCQIFYKRHSSSAVEKKKGKKRICTTARRARDSREFKYAFVVAMEIEFREGSLNGGARNTTRLKTSVTFIVR